MVVVVVVMVVVVVVMVVVGRKFLGNIAIWERNKY